MTWLWAAWAVVRKIAAAVPWQAWAALGVVVGIWWFGASRYSAGEDAADARHQKADEAARQARARRAAQIATQQAEVTVRVETEYVDRIKVVREAGKTIIREVPVYVPATDPPLSGGFRLLHDAAAAGVPGIPDTAGIADAAAVPAQVAARTVADNYGTCREQAEQLSALQSWVSAQREIANAHRE